MAHSLDAEAVDTSTSISMDDAAAVFDDEPVEGEELPDDELEGEADEGEPEDDFEDDEDDEEDGPEAVTSAPVSLNAEEKEAYSQLPPEAQQFVTQLETRRATQVQEATTKASDAQRSAEARAATADAEAKRNYANQLKQIGDAIAPQMPDPSQFRDTQSYLLAEAQYRQSKAQHDEYMQQVSAVETEASTEERNSFIQQRDRELMQIPEIANPETRNDYLNRAMGAAELLGYDKSELAENMSASDLKALARVAEMQDKAKQWDDLQNKSKMKKVRSHKRNLRPGAAQSQGSGKRRSDTKALNTFQKNPSSMAAAAAVFND